MPENWIKVFESEQAIRSEIMRGKLEQQAIAAVILNKRDSSYPIFGKYEVHVLSTDLEGAQKVVEHEGTVE